MDFSRLWISSNPLSI